MSCEYCSKGKIDRQGVNLWFIVVPGTNRMTLVFNSGTYQTQGTAEIHYCPMCGAPLSEEAKNTRHEEAARELTWEELKHSKGQPILIFHKGSSGYVLVSHDGVCDCHGSHMTFERMKEFGIRCFDSQSIGLRGLSEYKRPEEG